MKKIFALVAALAITMSVASAQTTIDDKVLKVDIGLGSVLGGLPISASYEQGFKDMGNGAFITLGGYLGYEGYNNNIGEYKYSYSNIFVAAQANYYLAPVVDKMDLYGGVRVGYNVASVSVEPSSAPGASAGGFVYTVHIGANYFLSDNLAINAELGYGIAYLNLGVAYKF